MAEALHRFQNVRLTGDNVNVMSVRCSTYCLSERRSMELCVFVELDLTACLDVSYFGHVSFHFSCILYETTLGSVFWIPNCPEDRFKIL